MLCFAFLTSSSCNHFLQVIYMARNPKDLVVSYYQFHRSLRTMSYRGTFQEFCRRFMNDKRKPHTVTWALWDTRPQFGCDWVDHVFLSFCIWPLVGYGSWFEHVQEFWEHRMDSNVLFLKYEDMYKVQYMRTRPDYHMLCDAVHTHSLYEWKTRTFKGGFQKESLKFSLPKQTLRSIFMGD